MSLPATDEGPGTSRPRLPNVIERRALILGFGALAFASRIPSASAEERVLRFGYQKYGNAILLKARGTLEPRLAAIGYRVVWTEFPFGPPLLEAIIADAIDFGHTGEAPPIFAQAAGNAIVYVANEPPAPEGEAILVRKDSSIQSLVDLEGKKIAYAKGSNAHYFAVKALEKAGVPYGKFEPVHLAPADARAAFEGGKVDAWAIWDPYYAAVEAQGDARVLTDGRGIVSNHQFFLARRTYADANAGAIKVVLSALKDVDAWVTANTSAAAKELGPFIGISASIVETALRRQSYGIENLNDKVIAEQQGIADRFHALGLLPKPINVRGAVWKLGPR